MSFSGAVACSGLTLCAFLLSSCGAPDASGAATPSVLGASGAAAEMGGGVGSGSSPPAAQESPERASEVQDDELPIASAAGSGRAAAGDSSTLGDDLSSGDAAGAEAGAGAGGASPTEPSERPAVTLWIAGDSTVANGNTPCPRGWGGAFAPHFDERVTVTNLAAGGRSVHTWLYEVQDVIDSSTGECALTLGTDGQPVLQARWQTVLDGMQPGDYLFVQFGINDGDPTCDRHVGIEAFKRAYGMMALAARERGAQPIFLTPVSSIACNGNTARGSRGAFVPATLEVGLELDVPVIDLHALSVGLFQSLAFCPVAGGDVSAETTGPVGEFFCDDHTHFSSEGAQQIADLVAEALRAQQSSLSGYLR